MDHELAKSLKAPDKLQLLAVNFFGWMGRNQKQMLVIITPLIVIFAAGLGYQSWDSSRAEKRRAELSKLMTTLDKDKKNEKAFNDLRLFFTAGKNSAEGQLAGLILAKSLITDKKFGDAKEILKDISVQKSAGSLHQQSARLSLVGVYEELAEFDSAVKEEDILLGMIAEDLKPTLLLMKGKTLLLKNAPAEAKPIFETIIQKHADSVESQKARAYLAVKS